MLLLQNIVMQKQFNVEAVVTRKLNSFANSFANVLCFILHVTAS